jgi:hypothetical protein
VSLVLMIIAVGLLAIIVAHRRRGAIAEEKGMSTPTHNSLVLGRNNLVATQVGLYTQSHTNVSQLPTLQDQEGYVYDFINGSPENNEKPLDVNRQEVYFSTQNSVLRQLEHIMSQHVEIIPSNHSKIERQRRPLMNDGPDHIIHTCRMLGGQLSRAITTSDIDMTLLDNLHEQLEQYGIWAMPFIASALSREIHEDMLLNYSLNLCVKRLSAVQHKGEFEPALCDLTRYLDILHRFFPTLFKHIIPNLQQGLTMALHLATTNVEAETAENSLLAMLRQVFADIGAAPFERRVHRE